MRETRVRSLGREDPLEKEMAIHSSILAWRIPWTEKPSRLQSTGSQRVGHDWATSPSPSPSRIHRGFRVPFPNKISCFVNTCVSSDNSLPSVRQRAQFWALEGVPFLQQIAALAGLFFAETDILTTQSNHNITQFFVNVHSRVVWDVQPLYFTEDLRSDWLSDWL